MLAMTALMSGSANAAWMSAARAAGEACAARVVGYSTGLGALDWELQRPGENPR